MRSKRLNISKEERIKKNNSLIKNLKIFLENLNWNRICIYRASDGEPDIMEISSIFSDKEFYFPVIEKEELLFFKATFESHFVKGSFGILEPFDKSKSLEIIDEKTVICVPGVAFDREGGRIGRGKGYYDRFLFNKASSALKIGIAYEFQVVSYTLPIKSSDVKMNLIITDKNIWKF